MRLLLDTHVFLWTQDRPRRLGAVIELVGDPDNERFLSVASVWEIAIKCAAGRLVLTEHPERYVPDRREALQAESLAVSEAHALAAARLPHLHGDPFDRMLVAQAQMLELTIVTADRAVAQYDVESILI
ncbi:MAG: type II toxin-antitoxin system VapC family toxin [Solirubrobacteraceae bacterium]